MPQHDDPPHHSDRPPITRTEADVTSDTRFGPRPVPEDHRRPAGPAESRRIPPHGDVSPDGRHAWPRPSATAKWLVWGGTTLGAAALTAGTVIAARHVLGLLSDRDDDRPARSSVAPRFAALSPEQREAMRQRARARESDDARHAARLRAEAMRNAAPPRRPPPRPGLLQEVEANTASMSNGVDHVMRSLGAAVMGFRTVAGQASAIVREFDGAARLIRDTLGRRDSDTGPRPQGARPSRAAPMPDLRDDPLVHDPLDGPDAEDLENGDPRLHRL